MVTVPLQEPLVDQVHQVTELESLHTAEFIAKAVRRHLATCRQKRIAAETTAWYRLPAEERASYAGRYVAVFEGKVIDNDPDRLALYLRLRARYGRQPILITEGGDQPIPVYRVRSPRRA